MRKKYRLSRRLQNNSGIILFIVLWALVILTALALSLGRGTNIELTLAKYSMAKLKAKYLAWAGLVYAIHQISLDSENENSSKQDTLYYCAIPMDAPASAESLFKQRPLGDGYFEVAFPQYDTPEDQSSFRFGLADEERKININALSTANAGIFSSLIVVLGFDEESAKTIAFSAVDWVDQDDNLSQQSYGAEADEYTALGYHCKNLPFDSLEELLLVKGMTRDVFKKIKNYITIFPKTGGLKINFDTASEIVLKALAYSSTGGMTQAGIADADALAEKLVRYRAGEDGIEFTEDDRVIDWNEAALNIPEKDLYQAMSSFRTNKSNFLHIVARGRVENLEIDAFLEAVISREDLAVVYWKTY